MKTLSDEDWSEAEKLLRKFMSETNDRKSWVAVKELLARIEVRQPTTNPLYPGGLTCTL